MDFRNEKAKKLKQGAIRAMFDRAATMTDVISMGIGEPDMPTPELVCRAGAEALQQGLTHYTPNAGTMQLRRAIAERASVAPVAMTQRRRSSLQTAVWVLYRCCSL